MSIKILYLSPSSQLGGAERSLIDNIFALRQQLPLAELSIIITAAHGDLASELETLGVQVFLVPLPAQISKLGDSSFKLQNIIANLWQLLIASSELFKYWRNLQQIINKINPDLIDSNGFKTHLLVTSLNVSCPIIWRLRDFISSRSLMKKLLALVKNKVALAIANSEATKDDWHSVFPQLPIKVIYNVVDITRFTPLPDSKPTMSIDHADLIKVGLVATYARWKGQEIFLQAIADLAQQQPLLITKARFYIVGGAIYETDRSQYSRSELIQLAQDLNIENWVEFIDFRTDIESIYNSLDIVVHASTKPEPFGRTIVEAMACEKAVIVANAGGAAELFTPNQDAIGVAPGNPQALAEAIRDLIASPEQRLAIGQAARKTVIKRFNRDRLGAELVSMYSSLIVC